MAVVSLITRGRLFKRHGRGRLVWKQQVGIVDLLLLAGVPLQPLLIARNVTVRFAFVKKQTGVAESAEGAEGAAKLAVLGVFAVLVVAQGLLVSRLVVAVLALVDGDLRVLAMLDLHVFLQLALTLASKAAHFADESLPLVAQLVAAQLVGAVAAIRTLIAMIPAGNENTKMEKKP